MDDKEYGIPPGHDRSSRDGGAHACTIRVTAVERAIFEAPSFIQRQNMCLTRIGNEDVPGGRGKHGRGCRQANEGAESKCNESTHVNDNRNGR